jgi:hypothetical protein
LSSPLADAEHGTVGGPVGAGAGGSVPVLAKSSKARLATWMMCSAMKGAPSFAPCSASFRQHSHYSTAQPEKQGSSVARELGEEDRQSFDRLHLLLLALLCAQRP